MTIKKRQKKPPVVIRTYRFVTNKTEVHYDAESLDKAKLLFQEQYGFYPEKGVNYVVAAPDTQK